MSTTYLYFLVGTGHLDGYFKIGISIRPYTRQLMLAQNFDLERSLKIGYTKEQARENERWLHGHFAKHRVHLVAPEGSVRNLQGYTEWFNMDCFDEAVEILKFNESITCIEKIERQHRKLNVEIPEDLFHKIKLAAIYRSTTIGRDIVALLEEYYSGKIPDQQRQSDIIASLNESKKFGKKMSE